MDHFARVLPIVGRALFEKRVAVVGFPAATPVVRYLAANGVRRWVWQDADRISLEMLMSALMAQHGAALPLEVAIYTLPPTDVDIVLAVGDTFWAEGEQLAEQWSAPLIQVPTLTGWEWECVAPLVALQVRNQLLEQPNFALPPALSSEFLTPLAKRGRVLITGLGSLGSIAALHLAPYVEGLVLADPDTVDPYNPVRQAFPRRLIGQNKAEVLASLVRREGLEVVSLPYALHDEDEVMALVEAHSISAVLVVTGTHADYAIARGLEAAGVPHVVGRCYPRARYWEGIVVEAGTPTFEEIRGHLYVGPSPVPTPEQQRAYSDEGALEDEPATLIESGWAAVWLARLLHQLLYPTALRELWFLQHLADRHRCFIGGLYMEATERGMAYGINHIGQVRGYGVAEVVKPIA